MPGWPASGSAKPRRRHHHVGASDLADTLGTRRALAGAPPPELPLRRAMAARSLQGPSPALPYTGAPSAAPEPCSGAWGHRCTSAGPLTRSLAAQIVIHVVEQKQRPQIPAEPDMPTPLPVCYPRYKALMERCWSNDAVDRPAFEAVITDLRWVGLTVGAPAVHAHVLCSCVLPAAGAAGELGCLPKPEAWECVRAPRAQANAGGGVAPGGAQGGQRGQRR